ncbi:hypothetical protein [Cognatazoarcus halotolerans]|uniref:hypothetical protein n=1 Tax=Cognatazoarcus halotolerans TaxID=2686016 RepID=UPI00135B18EE|nr:hypothetical protein [Cognatazoarcus halotolerans]
MLWLDIALARRQDAEQAFFEFEDEDTEDDIPRMQLIGFSDFELSHLGMLLVGGYEAALVLDGEAPDEIIAEIDRTLIAALAALPRHDLDVLATRWANVTGNPGCGEALNELHDFACRARAEGLSLLYAQGNDEMADDDQD